MTSVFIKIFNMSITASYVALAVIMIRFILRKMPKNLSYVLWSVVLFRMASPISIRSTFSFLNLFNKTNDYIPNNIARMTQPAVNFNITSVNQVINNSLPQANPLSSVNPMQTLMSLVSVIWFIVLVILLLNFLLSYIKIYKRVQYATLLEDNVYESDKISSPFVLGIIKPKIYIPVNMSPSELPYVLEHEKTHIKRLDHLIKPFAFLLLTLHWFNPIMWLSYFLMSKDMEMSCDESVLNGADKELSGAYCQSLLSLSTKHSGLFSQLAFGESNIKSRIKNILNYKKPTFWISSIALILMVVFVVSLASDGINNEIPSIYIQSESNQVVEGIIGTYSWDYGNEKVEADSVDPFEFDYNAENTINAYAGELLLISHGDNQFSQSPTFNLEEMTLINYDQPGELLSPDFVSINNGGISFKAPDKMGAYIFRLHLIYESGNVSYGFRVKVKREAPMKGLELYVWKNSEVTGNDDTFFTLLPGTNRLKEATEIYDLNVAVKSIEEVNDLLSNYEAATELFINQMNERDFTKLEMEAILESLNFPIGGNGSIAVGVWQNESQDESQDNTFNDAQIALIIEDKLESIMESPAYSSNPQDYINAHQEEYKDIIIYGHKAIEYLTQQFELGNNNDLRGHLMMRIIRELLGDSYQSDDYSLLPQEWFDKVFNIADTSILNNFYHDLTQLSTLENQKLEAFRKDYDDDILIDLELISICKMYFYSWMIGDYETQYELHTTNEEFVMMSKEEFISNRAVNKMTDFKIFEAVYNINTEINTDNEEHAMISWKSRYGHVSEEVGAFTYGFSLIKDGEVWKVSFAPMN